MASLSLRVAHVLTGRQPTIKRGPEGRFHPQRPRIVLTRGVDAQIKLNPAGFRTSTSDILREPPDY